MNLKTKALTKSIWAFHISAASCNNCDIEILDCFTPRFDVERFGIQLIGSVRHADVLVIAGALNRKCLPLVKKNLCSGAQTVLSGCCGPVRSFTKYVQV